MTNIRNPQLRIRDQRRLVESAMHEVSWDAGIESKNEWVYASLENEVQRRRLLDWLHSKGIEKNEEALWFDPGWSQTKKVSWQDILNQPEVFFEKEPFQIVNLDFGWVLEYMKEGVARFGRWTKKEPTESPTPII